MKNLFVSKEHRRQAALRTHRAYHCIVYIVLCFSLGQIPFATFLLEAKNTGSALKEKTALAIEEQKVLSASSESLLPLSQKIQEANLWSYALSQKTTISEILSKLENAISEEICLTEITIHNRALNTKDPDRLELEIQGFAKTPEAVAWQKTVEQTFKGWNLSTSRVRRVAGGSSQETLIPFSLILRKAPSTFAKGGPR